MEAHIQKPPSVPLYTLVLEKQIQMICWFHAFIELYRALGLLQYWLMSLQANFGAPERIFPWVRYNNHLLFLRLNFIFRRLFIIFFLLLRSHSGSWPEFSRWKITIEQIYLRWRLWLRSLSLIQLLLMRLVWIGSPFILLKRVFVIVRVDVRIWTLWIKLLLTT